VARVAPEQAYPGLTFRRRTRNWWARLVGQPPECVHLETETSWMATLVPDTLYLRGKGMTLRRPPRPEVSLCRGCLMGIFEPELTAYSGRVVAFEPDFAALSQCFFVASPDFALAGLREEVAAAIDGRLKQPAESCARCERRATWLWLDRAAVPSLDDVAQIRTAEGQWLCATHGTATLCRCLKGAEDVNLFYLNLPYGEAGAYVWI
jgi:hypothetical protein